MKRCMEKLVIGIIASVVGTVVLLVLAVGLLLMHCSSEIEYVETPEEFGGDICFITNDHTDETTQYYTLDADRHKIAEIPAFENEAQIYLADNNYFDCEIIDGKITNTVLHRDLKNLDGEAVENVENRAIIDRIFDLAAQIDHDIFHMAIIVLDDQYFVQVELNVNWQCPCEVYYYNQNTDQLGYLYRFQHKEIIGAKMIDAEAF